MPKKFHQLKTIFAALALAMSSLYAPPTRAQASSDCQAVEFIFARGSGEALNDVSYRAWTSSISSIMSRLNYNSRPGLDSYISYGFYELGSSATSRYRYPAVAMDQPTRILGAVVSAGNGDVMGASIAVGASELVAHLAEVHTTCPRTRFVLGGYSQGALVLDRTLAALDQPNVPASLASKILYVATFGDPKLYLPEGKSTFGRTPEACRGRSLSSYRVFAPNCYDYEGILGSIRPYVPSRFAGKIGTWCNDNDLMCSAGLNLDDHTAYVSKNLYYSAALKIKSLLKQIFPTNSATYLPTTNFQGQDVVFLIDRTASMGATVAKFLPTLSRIATAVIEQGGRVALYSYGDDFEFATAELERDFGSSPEQLADMAMNLRFRGGGSGDPDESPLAAIRYILEEDIWQADAGHRSIIVVTDAGYHDPDAEGSTLASIVQATNTASTNIYSFTPDTIAPKYHALTGQTGGHSYELDTEEFVFTFNLAGATPFSVTAATSGATFAAQGTSDSTSFIAPTTDFSPAPSISNLTVSGNSAYDISFTTDADMVLLAVNDTILGQIPLSSGEGRIRIEDISPETTIRLIPYSASRRGDAAEISPDQSSSEPPSTPVPPASQNPAPEPGSSDPSRPDSSTNSLVGLNVPPLSKFVPLVPNAGHRGRNRS